MKKNTSYDLYGGTPPHVKFDTSIAAAEQIVDTAMTLRAAVYRAIRNLGDATDDEIEQHLNMRHQTASARRRELVLLGKVRDTGKRRKTRSGRAAAVWTAV